MSYAQDSIALDLAYLNREVPAAIKTLAQDALKEVEDAANSHKTGDNGVEGDEAVLSGVAGREIDTSGGDG